MSVSQQGSSWRFAAYHYTEVQAARPDVRRRTIAWDGCHKLSYYHGMLTSLFDLCMEPGDQRDLAASPAHAATRHQLEALVLRDRDPVAIEAEIEGSIPTKALLQSWAQKVKPPNTPMWKMLPHHNRLDEPPDG